MSSLIIEVDPLNHYTSVPDRALLEACGMILYWIVEDDSDTLQEQVNKNYQFGMYEMKGGTVTPEGIYEYPEDPPLYPLVKWERGDEVAYMYPHAIMSFIHKGVTFVTRVD